MNENTWEDLFSALSEGALVLTATKRLSRRLRLLYDRRMVESGHSAWRSPEVRSGDGWLRQAAETLGEGWRILDPLASRQYWKRIIEEDSSPSVPRLVQTVAAAKEAEEAHSLIAEYGCDLSDYPLTEDHDAFLRWRELYLQACRDGDWLDPPSLPQRITSALLDGELPVPEKVVFAGFDDFPPRFRRISKALTDRGSKVLELSPALGGTQAPIRIPCADAREEVRTAARWARRLLEEGEADIGIVVPDLAGYRKLIERIFREEIDPEAQIRLDAEETRFSLSLGESLAEQGAVAAALEILSSGNRLSLPQAGYLLRSPYLKGGISESVARARLDSRLRRGGAVEVSISRLQSMAIEGGAPILGGVCTALAGFCKTGEKLPPGAWAFRFTSLLDTAGWPGDRPLDSREFQVVKIWREKALSRLSAFDLVSGAVSREEAVSLLQTAAEETLFKPESPDGPIQVMGLLETAGLHFRHLWIIGLHDGVMPAPARPNPFLPVPMQVSAGMPHADPAREVKFAARVIDRLCAAAPEVVVSHPQREGDASLSPSPFIRHLEEGEVRLAPRGAPADLWRAGNTRPEILEDDSGPPLAGDEHLSGGMAILKDQALCPFRAFVRHRLKAAALEVPDIGLDARDRGTLLHKVLELFWNEVRDLDGLLALEKDEIVHRVEDSVEKAMMELFPESDGRLPAPIIDLEKQRLSTLVLEWLVEVEFNRRPFTVLEREGEASVEFGGLEFSTRMDRIDRLEDGSIVVLDYKTGIVDAVDLIADRLIEPQLPTYGIGCGGEMLAGVAFASLRRGNCAFCGVARDPGLLPKVPAISEWKKAGERELTGWEELLAQWEEQLQDLGRAVASGEAEVNPVSREKACRICDFAAFCRIAENDQAAEGEEE